MFGHQDDNQDQATNGLVTGAPVSPTGDDNNGVTSTLSEDASEDNTAYLDSLANDTSRGDQLEASNGPSDGATSSDDQAGSSTDNSASTAYDPSVSSHRDDNTSSDNSGLLDIKKQALDELSPLVDHLDQTPEEKFKTTMMMIQANDNQALIPDAYKAAKTIGDEKARARALLDIVNEINYFTHKD